MKSSLCSKRSNNDNINNEQSLNNTNNYVKIDLQTHNSQHSLNHQLINNNSKSSSVLIERANSPQAYQAFISRTKQHRQKTKEREKELSNRPGSGNLFTGKPTVFKEFNLITSLSRKEKSKEKIFNIKSLEKPISAEVINPYLNASDSVFSLDEINDINNSNRNKPNNSNDYNNIYNNNLSEFVNKGRADSNIVNYNFLNNNFYCGDTLLNRNNNSNIKKVINNRMGNNQNISGIESNIKDSNIDFNSSTNNFENLNSIASYLLQTKNKTISSKTLVANNNKNKFNMSNNENISNLNKFSDTINKMNSNSNNIASKSNFNSKTLIKTSSTPNITPLDKLYKPSDIRVLNKTKQDTLMVQRMNRYVNNNINYSNNINKSQKEVIINNEDNKVVMQFSDAMRILHKDLVSLDI